MITEMIGPNSTHVDGMAIGMFPYAGDGLTWADFDFSRATIDMGPSPAGNEGLYLKVPLVHHIDGARVMDTWHRLYPAEEDARIERTNGAWFWVIDDEE